MLPKTNGSAGKPFQKDPETIPREVSEGFRTRERLEPAGVEPGLAVHKREVEYQQTAYGPGRLTGPVAMLKSLAENWRLTNPQLATLTGYWPYEAHNIVHLLSGTVSIRDKDQEDRIGYLLAIYALLHRIFQDADRQYAWLTEKKEALEGLSPLERMLKGSMEDLWVTKRLVEKLAGL